MKSTTVILGPYSISCDTLQGDANVFVDPNKTKLISVISSCDGVPEIPSIDAVLIHESIGCPADCDIRWYECQNTFGRTYKIVPSACGVYITNFENGFLFDGCDASVFGSDFFCYGRTYVDNQSFSSHIEDQTVFVFDGHTFTVSGHSSTNTGIFDCSECESVTAFAQGQEETGKGDLPTSVPGAEKEDIFIPVSPATTGQEESESTIEDKILWETEFPNKINDFVDCFEESIFLAKTPCESTDNPSVCIMPSGHAVVAFEDRAEDGTTLIRLSIIKTSVNKNIIYHRSLGRGRLLNENGFEYGTGTFEIFDDLVFDLNDQGLPTSNLYVGFLSGPLKGNAPLLITQIIRGTQEDGRTKHSLYIDTAGRKAEFKNSNDVYDVAYFIMEDVSSLPGGESIQDFLTLPPHLDALGKQCPVANPSVIVPNNNIMLDGSQYVYVTYQAFENKQWNIYVVQIRISDNESSLPVYVTPYDGQSSPISGSENIADFGENTNVIYKVNSVSQSDGYICALFTLHNPDDGRQIFYCDVSGTTTDDCGNVINANVFYVNDRFSLACTSTPIWTVGSQRSGVWPPPTADYLTGLFGGSGDCGQSPTWGSGDNLCLPGFSCSQYYVLDDPYCPLPYVSFTYKPEDLWVIKTGNDFITRVSYNLSVNAFETFAEKQSDVSGNIDFMFVIDFSNSMQNEINQIRDNVAVLANSLSVSGIDFRFGLVAFGRSNISDPNYAACTSPCYSTTACFNGLYGIAEESGFTRSTNILQQGLSIAANGAGSENGYSAIQYALNHEQFGWRPNAKRFIFFVTDTIDHVGTSCGSYPNTQVAAGNAIRDSQCGLGMCLDLVTPDGTCIGGGSGYLGLSNYADPSFDPFSVAGPYDVIFSDISSGLISDHQILTHQVVERDDPGYEVTFLKSAQVVITYSGDLSDKWTNDRSDFVFKDNAPIVSGASKGLTSLPFDLEPSKVYGIDSVHIKGKIKNWVYFSGEAGAINYVYPHIGYMPKEKVSPVLVAEKGTRPRIKCNHRNDIIIAYQTYGEDTPQIEIKGTGDFHQNSITGPKGGRITKFFDASDFAWSHRITDIDEGVNQLCDIIVDKNDITHITWQSNRDNYWEIYYANSFDLFEPVRVTESKSRSAFPRIEVDTSGTVYIVYQDNRFGPFESMLVFKDERRILPLTQQDAYLASLRSGYSHYTNTLPILISNPSKETPVAGLLWGSKIKTGAGNDDEDFIFRINPDDGTKSNGCDTSPNSIVAMAGDRSGTYYSITSDNKVLKHTQDIQEEQNIDCQDLSEIGTINFSEGFYGDVIVDDTFDRPNGTEVGGVSDAVWNKLCLFQFSPEISNNYDIICSDNYACNVFFGDSVNLCGICTSCPPVVFDIVLGGLEIATEVPCESTSMLSELLWLNSNIGSDIMPPFHFFINKQSPGPATPVTFVSIEQNAVNSTIKIGYATNSESGTIFYTENQSTISPVFFEPDTSADWIDIKIDSIVTEGVGGLKNLTINVYRFDTLILTHSYENLNSSSFRLGKLFGYQHFVANPSTIPYTGNVAVGRILLQCINADGIMDNEVLDAACDQSGRLWASVGQTTSSGSKRISLFQISTSDASIQRSSSVVASVDQYIGGLTVDSLGKFYLAVHKDDQRQLYRSNYPAITSLGASFNFSKISNLSQSIRVLTSDYLDQIFGADEGSSLFLISGSGETTFIANLTDDEYDPYDGFMPVGTLAGLAYQHSGKTSIVQNSKFFHVLIEFYDNIGLLGEPSVIVDSRDNLESFIRKTTETDEYVDDAKFDTAKGVYITGGKSSYIYFDASHFRPGQSNLSYPYSFDTNQAYFPRVFIISSDGSISLAKEIQNSSFSCNRCTKLGDNVFDSHGCSFSFLVSGSAKYNFILDVYGDAAFNNKLASYNAVAGDSDLAFFEVNNQPASEIWGGAGLEVSEDEEFFVQFYPNLDPTSGLVCGVKYYIRVLKCVDFDCSNTSTFTSGEFKCECSSNIFTDKLVALSSMSRWQSSANGYSDTRVTDVGNIYKPVIRARSSEATLILFEDYNGDDPYNPRIKGATFRKNSPDDMLGSGTRSWFDYDFDIHGQNPEVSIDLFDRPVIIYERPDQKHGRDLSKNELKGNSIYYKICRFPELSEEMASAEGVEKCDFSQIESNVITKDAQVFASIIKKILIKSENVLYYTYNSDGQATPVVNDCNVVLEIYGSQESVAFRIRNEDQNTYTEWCSFAPEISNYYTEKEWKISNGSGIKEICIQVMTYSGITSEFCIPVVADYSRTIYETKLYSDTGYTTLLPSYNGMYVASTLYNQTTGLSEDSKTIYIEIIPNEKLDLDHVNFDVLQQGANDQFDLSASKVLNSSGREVFRGFFVINKEDNVLNKDGLARIRAKFPNKCDQDTFVASADTFQKDTLNRLSGESQSSIAESEKDNLASYRQSLSGMIGPGMVIRPSSEDPYFVFGNPDFYLDIKEPNYKGVKDTEE